MKYDFTKCFIEYINTHIHKKTMFFLSLLIIFSFIEILQKYFYFYKIISKKIIKGKAPSRGWNDLNQLIKISDLNHKFDKNFNC